MIVDSVLKPMVQSLAGDGEADVHSMDLAECAQRFLLEGGMDREQLELLKSRLTGG